MVANTLPHFLIAYLMQYLQTTQEIQYVGVGFLMYVCPTAPSLMAVLHPTSDLVWQ